MNFIINNILYRLNIFIYDLSITIFNILLVVSSFFDPKTKMMLAGRKETWKLMKSSLKLDGKKAWFHCASLGEFEQARPVIEALKEKEPSLKIIITFFSPSGYENKKDYSLAELVCYLPADTKKNAQDFVSFFKPDIVFFVKYDFWFHFINEISNKKISLYLLSATFRKDQIFFKWYGSFFKNLLKKFTLLFLQDEKSLSLLSEFGFTNTLLTGDTRFDNVQKKSVITQDISLIEKFKGGDLVLIAGSSYGEEEQLIHKFISSQPNLNLKIIIAPHHVDEKNIERIVHNFSDHNAIRLKNLDILNFKKSSVLVIDRIGLLSSIYRLANIAMIGGGFGNKGVHNILEALAYGIPILIGPNNHQKFPELKTTIQEKVCFVINNQKEFDEMIHRFINNLDLVNSIKLKSEKILLENSGSTFKVIAKISKIDEILFG